MWGDKGTQGSFHLLVEQWHHVAKRACPHVAERATVFATASRDSSLPEPFICPSRHSFARRFQKLGSLRSTGAPVCVCLASQCPSLNSAIHCPGSYPSSRIHIGGLIFVVSRPAQAWWLSYACASARCGGIAVKTMYISFIVATIGVRSHLVHYAVADISHSMKDILLGPPRLRDG